MLMLTLLHLSAVHSTPCTCSNLQWLQAEHSLRCLGYTIELELVLRTWCGGEEVGSHEIRHEVLHIFAVLANVPVVDCSNKRFAVENLRSPETSILAVVGAVLLRFLYFHLSASASTGGWHEGTQKQTMREDCNFCATVQLCSVCFFDKIIACSDADAHTFASLCCSLYTLYLFKLTVATGRTQSSLPRLHNRIGTCTSHLVWG